MWLLEKYLYFAYGYTIQSYIYIWNKMVFIQAKNLFKIDGEIPSGKSPDKKEKWTSARSVIIKKVSGIFIFFICFFLCLFVNVYKIFYIYAVFRQIIINSVFWISQTYLFCVYWIEGLSSYCIQMIIIVFFIVSS